jgi:hypothetical protein
MSAPLARPTRSITILILITLAVIALALVLATVAARYLPYGIDWDVYRPAVQAVLTGTSPYRIPLFWNAPWILIPLLPYALLPAEIGRALLLFTGLTAYYVFAKRMGAHPLAAVAFVLSFFSLLCLKNSNVDWLILLGLLLPPKVGLFFMLAKPQMGIGVAIWWLVEAWREGGMRRAVSIVWPVTLAFGLSFVVFGLWPLTMLRAPTYSNSLAFNASLFPYSVPIGLALLIASIRRRNVTLALVAAPCFSPHVVLHTWIVCLAPFLRHKWQTVALSAASWAIVPVARLLVSVIG